MIKQKILIIDDNKADIVLIRDLFDEAGINREILWAESSKQGLEIAKKENPEVIFLDTLMPEMGGFEACEELRNCGFKKIHVVMMSGALGMDNEVLAKKYGANSFCLKNPESILSAMMSFLVEKEKGKDLGKSLNILLVEDNAGDRILFRDALLETGIKHDLIECDSVSQAIIKVQTEKPDIIFMDIMLPVINGADYVESMKEDPQLNSTPVIFLTGIVEGSRKKQLNVGGRQFLALGKPVSIVNLIESIDEALNKR